MSLFEGRLHQHCENFKSVISGNDLARVLRWGPGYNGEDDPLNLLRDVIEAEEIQLDRYLHARTHTHNLHLIHNPLIELCCLLVVNCDLLIVQTQG